MKNTVNKIGELDTKKSNSVLDDLIQQAKIGAEDKSFADLTSELSVVPDVAE